MNEMSVAVLIPCFNEALTVGKVVEHFRRELPTAHVYVFDNGSSDDTAEIAREHGAIVIREKRRGKGNVVRSMLQKIEADYYVLVDGDDTYPAERVHDLLEIVMQDQADMAVANRLKVYDRKAFRPFHILGNNLVRSLVNRLFRAKLKDIMSGYRVMNREFVDSITLLAHGFDVETEMTLQSLNKGLVIKEVDVPYRERGEGSVSKLRTFSDGFLVLKAIFVILRDYRPLFFFGILAALVLAAGLAFGAVVVEEFIATRYITHVPLAILSVGCVLSSLLLLGVGVILDCVRHRFDEVYSYVRKCGANRSTCGALGVVVGRDTL